MKKFYLFFKVFLFLNIPAICENITAELFQQPAITGANMTITFNSSSLDQYEGGQIAAFHDINGDSNTLSITQDKDQRALVNIVGGSNQLNLDQFYFG